MNLTIIGAGKMGEALARAIINAGIVAPGALVLADVDAARAEAIAAALGASATDDNPSAVSGATVVILAVKPGLIPIVGAEIAPALKEDAVVISIAAGVTLDRLRSALGPRPVFLIRAMPNTPCLVGKGVIGLCFDTLAHNPPADVRRMVHGLLEPLGLVAEVTEAQLDAVTGLSGSGPAFVAVFIEALADGGVLAGLSRELALRFTIQTVLGTAELLATTKQTPSQVKDAVSSPGGTTIAGVAALEQAGLRAAAIAAVTAATARSRELSKT